MNNRWNRARLIPTTGIGTQAEQERRATSGLLAAMTTVEDFGRRLTSALGAPEGMTEAFVRVPLTVGGTRFEAHGMLRTESDGTSWTALVEVSTGSRPLDAERLEQVLEAAREHGIDALLTISNEVAPLAGQHPTPIAKEKRGRVAMLHHPWSWIAAEAAAQSTRTVGEDPLATRILADLVHYLEDPASGTLRIEVGSDSDPDGVPQDRPGPGDGDAQGADAAAPGTGAPRTDSSPTTRIPRIGIAHGRPADSGSRTRPEADRTGPDEPRADRGRTGEPNPAGADPAASCATGSATAEPQEDRATDGGTEVPAPRGPVRREIRIALRAEPGDQDPERPGWYRDRCGTGLLRWWDGSDWTTHVYELPSARQEVTDRLQNQTP